MCRQFDSGPCHHFFIKISYQYCQKLNSIHIIMRFFPRRLSDEEYVNRARKHIRTYLWVKWIFIPLFIVLLVLYGILLFKLVILIPGMAAEISKPVNYYWIGFPFGILCAIIFMIIVFNGFIFLQRRFMNRTEILTLKYFDQAKELKIHDEKDIAAVETIRHNIYKSCGIRWGWIIATSLLIISIFFYDSFYQNIVSQENALSQKNMYSKVMLLVGFNFGFFVSEKIGVLIVFLYVLFLAGRKEPLLVKYHDMVVPKKDPCQSG